MLGQSVSDPHHIEEGGEIRGMELLPITTVFDQKKTRTQISGRFEQENGIFPTFLIYLFMDTRFTWEKHTVSSPSSP